MSEKSQRQGIGNREQGVDATLGEVLDEARGDAGICNDSCAFLALGAVESGSVLVAIFDLSD